MKQEVSTPLKMYTPLSSSISRTGFFTFALALGVSEAAADWRVDGQNTFALEYYEVNGDFSRGLYADEGFQRHNDLTMNFSYSDSPYAQLDGYLLASSNHSAYRGAHGGRLNNAALRYQSGEYALPFRLEFGDFFATQSRRTLQRGLKGFQLELQPVQFAVPQSLQLFWGRSAENYDRYFDGRKDFYYGASWLVESGNLGAFALTHVSYFDDQFRQNNGDEGGSERVNSLAWENGFALLGLEHVMEAEYAYLSGESRALVTSGNPSVNGDGVFFQLSGFGSSGMNYLASYERNSNEFRPQGSSVSADRESIDLQWGQSLGSVTQLRVRGQQYRDALSSTNISRSRISGINLSSRLWQTLSVSTDLSFREEDDQLETVNRDHSLFSVNLSAPLTQSTNLRVGYQFQAQQDRLLNDTSDRQSANAGLDFSGQVSAWQYSVSPSLDYQESLKQAGAQSSNLALGLLASARTDEHQLSFSRRHTQFLNEGGSTEDNDTVQTRFQWRGHWQAHTLDLNLDWYRFELAQAVDDEQAVSFKASLAWTYRFDVPVQDLFAPTDEVMTLSEFSALGQLEAGRLYDESLTSAIEDAGWLAEGVRSGMAAYEGRLFRRTNARQLLLLEQSGQRLESANVLLGFDGPPSEGAYRTALDELLRRYGAPTRERTVGSFDGDIRRKLVQDGLIRIVEWQLEGGILRFGVPRPTAGDVRMELQFREVHAGLDSNDWGLKVLGP